MWVGESYGIGKGYDSREHDSGAKRQLTALVAANAHKVDTQCFSVYLVFALGGVRGPDRVPEANSWGESQSFTNKLAHKASQLLNAEILTKVKQLFSLWNASSKRNKRKKILCCSLP